MKKKVFLTICLIFFVVAIIAPVYAGLLDDIIDQGNDFSGTSTGIGPTISSFIKTDVVGIIGAIGNLVFAAVTVILGAKYIWSSAEGKAQVMESLPAFVLAIVFFYLGESLVTFLLSAGGEVTSVDNWDELSNNIIWIINTIVRYASFGGILVLGLKYMFSSAEGKSKIKTDMGGFFLGIVFVFSATSVVEFIRTIADEVI